MYVPFKPTNKATYDSTYKHYLLTHLLSLDSTFQIFHKTIV